MPDEIKQKVCVITRTNAEDKEEVYGHAIFCPGCNQVHCLDKRWSFNNNFDAPTFSPSLLCTKDEPARRCHSFITDGRIQFLNDSYHALKGTTVDLPLFHWD